MLADLFAKFLARRLVRWGLIALLNLIGFTSVVGIPVVVIVDILLVLATLQGIFVALRGPAVAAGNVAVKLFRVAAIGAAVCGVAGLIAAITLPHFPSQHTAQASVIASSTMPAAAHGEERARIPDLPSAQQSREGNVAEPSPVPTPAPTQPGNPSAQQVISLIDERNYAGALALIDPGAEIVEPLDGRTPLSALELDHRPDYYSDPDAYRLMKKLITTSGGLDRRLNDFGSILWHQLLYELGNDPQKFSEVLDVLLARGVDINQKNFHGQTLADTATWSYATQDIMIARGACGRLPNAARPQQSVCAN